MPVGRRVVVIGGGMTAIDIAVQSKRLGAEMVTIVYRRGPEQMKASRYEQELAQTSGVLIRSWARPVSIESHAGTLKRDRVRAHARRQRRARLDRRAFRIEADVAFAAVGQLATPEPCEGADLRVARPAHRRRCRAAHERSGVWAGGDCVHGGQDLTVSAVEDGKQAARSIAAALKAGR